MQYPELGSCFELACLRHTNGLGSRASFETLADECAAFIGNAAAAGRRVVVVGESFGATLALGTLERLASSSHQPAAVCLVNPATSYSRETARRFGPDEATSRSAPRRSRR